MIKAVVSWNINKARVKIAEEIESGHIIASNPKIRSLWHDLLGSNGKYAILQRVGVDLPLLLGVAKGNVVMDSIIEYCNLIKAENTKKSADEEIASFLFETTARSGKLNVHLPIERKMFEGKEYIPHERLLKIIVDEWVVLD